MWAYPRSSYLDHPSPEELSAAEVEARIHKVLDSTVIPSHGAGPDTLRRGIGSVRVSTLGPVSVAFTILSFHYACDFMQGLGDGCGELRDAILPIEASGQEASRASNVAAWTCEEAERERDTHTPPVVWRGNT
jgi:hypothetical protein